MPHRNARWPWTAWLLTIAATVAIYWPGLYGDFIFDDVHVIVANDTLAIDAPDAEKLLDAAFSTDTGPLKRPLAMLSFAANRSLTGRDPFGFKLTNVLIHALNACLLMVLLLQWLPRLSTAPAARAGLVARLTALIWAVHPVNLSAVLYVVQRMTLLATTGMLLGMLSYDLIRRRQIAGGGAGVAWWAVLAVAWAAAMLAKESAAVLPLYLLVVEIWVFRFVAWPRPSGLQWLPVAGFAAILVGGAAVMLDGIAGSYAGRAFSLGERLLTESRVVLDYARMVVLPEPTQFALFHDDIILSRGLFDPPATAACLAVLAAAVALVVRGKPAVLAFGLAWFGAGHVLESTVLPLELMHEHRNYLAAVGLIVVLTSAFEALARTRLTAAASAALALVLIAAPAAVTAMRAVKWADPWTLLAVERRNHPDSARTVYEYGRLSVKRGGELHNPSLYAEGLASVERAADMRSPQPSIALSSLLNQAIAVGNTARVERFTERIANEPRRDVRADAVRRILECQVTAECPPAPAPVMRLVGTVVNDPELPEWRRNWTLEWLAIYYARVLGDGAAGVDILRDVVVRHPWDLGRRIRLAEMLAANGRANEGRALARSIIDEQPLYFRLKKRAQYVRLRNVIRGAGAASP